jgi:hypothetical protein
MKLVASATGYDITVQESGGTEENMYRMEKRKNAQMGIMDAVLVEKKLGPSVFTLTGVDVDHPTVAGTRWATNDSRGD